MHSIAINERTYMATVINNPDSAHSDNSMGFVIGVLIAILVLGFLLVYARGFRVGGSGASGGAPSSAQINVPDKVQVDVNKNQ